ncbi:MAG: GNAT family N-acetyltransferase [Lachnospiraceae bacterium]|nr:GNAT family N-acetyltransferase [Lachnospiraceae bacterium]
MNYRKATREDAVFVTNIVQTTKAIVYPRYYPKEVVDFFGQLHCMEHVVRDIQENLVYVLEDNGVMVGTGSYKENHITRIYVLPEFQSKGYGTYIVKELEKDISRNYNTVTLDASLPACRFYEKNGYRTVEHQEYLCENHAVLVYDIMAKEINKNNQKIQR